MIVKTNVKINLGLNVLRRRPDGYHDIETLFVPCYSYGDVIEIITGDDVLRRGCLRNIPRWISVCILMKRR